jgi:Zn-dependent M28 family amino/carboxypeptidase
VTTRHFPADPASRVQTGPAGSGAVEQVFLRCFDAMGLPVEAIPFDGRSDYRPFIDACIPAGGLFTGADGIKTAAQSTIYGGVAGAPSDRATTSHAIRSLTTATSLLTRC